MPSRATAEQVQGIYPESVSFDTALAMNLRAASLLVDRAYGSLVDELTTQIEMRIAAAMLVTSQTTTTAAIKSERYAEGSITYQDQPSNRRTLGLWETEFGRQALALDTSGKLQGLGREQLKAGVLDRVC